MTDTLQRTSQEIEGELYQIAQHEQELGNESALLLDQLATNFTQAKATRRAGISQELEALQLRKFRLAEEKKRAIIHEEIQQFLAELAEASKHRAALPLLENQIRELEATLLSLRQQYVENQTIWNQFQKHIIYKTANAQKDPEGMAQVLRIVNEHQLHTPLMNEPGAWGRG